MKKLKNPNFYDYGRNGAVQNFRNFIEVDFGLDTKT
jgi:hypothetical protein